MFTWSDGRTCRAPCRACGKAVGAQHAVSLAKSVAGRVGLDFYRCDGCASLFPHPFDLPSYEHGELEALDAKFYTEVCAGIDVIARLLAAFRTRGVRTFLDVGCGYGFSVDFAARALGWDAYGLEPGPYGRSGKRDLGVAIDSDLLGAGSRHDTRQFDLVFSAEVLEHVEDPRAFLAVLARAVASRGYLVLTTPAAEFVTPDVWQEQVVASLSPGYHSVLYSQGELERQLLQLGFDHVRVEREADRLFVVAGRGVAVDDVVFDRRHHGLYLSYLDARATPEIASYVRDGLLFRLFKEQVNLGRLDAARATRKRLRRSLALSYGDDLHRRLRAPGFPATTVDFRTYGKIAPYFAAPLMFYDGMFELNHLGDAAAAAESFAASAALCRTDVDRPHAYFIESSSLGWNARFHEGLSRLRNEQRPAAIALFASLIAQDQQPDLMNRERLDQILVPRAMKETGVAYLQSGDPQQALVWLRRAAERCSTDEGRALLPEVQRLIELAARTPGAVQSAAE